MGYLHDKGIVHKDLTSRHILLDDKDKDKVVITDVGFNSVTDCQLFPGWVTREGGVCVREQV